MLYSSRVLICIKSFRALIAITHCISLVKHLLHLSIFNHTKNNLLLYNFFLYSFIDGRLPKPKYEHVYEVDVQNFEPELITNTFKMIGPYRMVVTTDAIKFFAGTKKNLLVVYHFHVKKCFFFNPLFCSGHRQTYNLPHQSHSKMSDT